MQQQEKKIGFSLIETLLYVALFAIIMSALTVFLSTLSASRINQQATAEVDQQASFVLRTLTQSLRNAASVNSPLTGATSSSLSLNTGIASTTPTIYSQIGEKLYVSEGSGPSVPLTNSRVNLIGLVFGNLTKSGGKAVISIDFILRAGTASRGKAEYNYQANYHDSVSLRQ